MLVTQEEYRLEKERLEIEWQDITSYKGHYQFNLKAKPFLLAAKNKNNVQDLIVQKSGQLQNIQDTTDE